MLQMVPLDGSKIHRFYRFEVPGLDEDTPVQAGDQLVIRGDEYSGWVMVIHASGWDDFFGLAIPNPIR